MNLRPAAFYARELVRVLPAEVFAPARSRLLWLPFLLSIIAASTVAVAGHWVPWFIVPLLSLVIGVCFGTLTFLGHETLHGAVVRGRRMRHLVGFIGFLPFMVSPRLWVAWHNHVHHRVPNKGDVDPDSNPTIAAYRKSGSVRFITDHITLGRRSATGFIGLLIGFTGQSGQVLSYAGKRGYLSRREHRWAIAESALGAAIWISVAVLVGPLAFLFVFVLPLMIANAIVMSFIITNHGLVPLTDVNDPLVNSMSVTTSRFIDWLTLNFGLHVEHHVFPSVSSRHAPAIRALLRERWPERYRSMPLWRALLALHRTARVYADDTTLTDPRTGATFATLVPNEDVDAPSRTVNAPEDAHERACGAVTTTA